jgi:predicted neuraminidase
MPRRVVSGPLSYGNPVLFAEDGVLRMFFCAAPGTWSAGNIRETRSTDNGETWNTPTTISALLGGNVRNPPLRRSDGSLLLPAYDDLLQRSLFFVQRDGAAWTLDSILETPFPARLIQPAIAIVDSSRWILAGRNGARGGTWFGVSADEGRTWRVAIQDDIPNPGAAVALLKVGDDRYALIYNNSRSDRTNLSIAFASNGGVSWAPPQVIIEGDGEYAYPAATLDRAGVIHVVFSQDRRTIEHRRVALGSQFSGPSAAD